jgi:hypothetical protein
MRPALLLPVLLLAAAVAAAQAPPKPAPGAVRLPPQVITSFPPAALVRVNGPAVMVPVPGRSGMQRVGNSGALILLAQMPNDEYSSERPVAYYLRLRDGWMSAAYLVGPWKPASLLPFIRRQLDAVANDLEKAGETAPVNVTLGDGKGPAPRVFVAESPAELVIFDGPPRYVPVAGTGLLRADNADRDLLMDRGSRTLYLAVDGEWLSAPALEGPWAFLDPGAVPADLRQAASRRSR